MNRFVDLPWQLFAPFAADTVPIFIGLGAGLFVLSVVLMRAWRPGAWSDSYWLLGLAVLLRILLIPVEPVLGRDIYRYLWEGRIQTAGFNPYLQAPADPALIELRDEYWERIDHPEIPTVYPPLSQILFRLTAELAGPSPRVHLVLLKAVFVFFDIGILLLLFVLARRRPVRWPLYAFHPVALLEVAWNGHVDVLSVFFLLLAVFFVLRGAWAGAALALVAGVWSKIVPVLAGLFVVRFHWRSLAGLVLGGLLALLSFALYFDPAMFSGLETFSKFWTFNSPLFGAVAGWQGAPAGPGWRAVSGVAVILAFLFYFFKPGERGLAERLTGLYFVLLAVSPVVHPWYTLVLIPLVALAPAGRGLAALTLSGTVFLSYEVYRGYLSDGIWLEKPLILGLVWGPVVLALGLDGWRRWRTAEVNEKE